MENIKLKETKKFSLEYEKFQRDFSTRNFRIDSLYKVNKIDSLLAQNLKIYSQIIYFTKLF